ncbi:MAG: type II secretion system secretin GspD [Armatimonadota bacterium]|nr:MAG: type II secretion system secretin GspD [Armatimonadota bacterium]
MEFYGTDIDHVLRLLSREAGVNIVKSDQVTGTLTVISPEPVSLEEAFQILNEVLAVRDFAMVRSSSGGYKVVPRAEAMRMPLPMRFGSLPEDVPAGDDLITQVIPLANLDATDVTARIEGMLSETARVIPTSTNSLIVTDSAGNIQQALRIIAEMERELSGGLRVFQLYYHDAEEMAQLVDTLVLSRGGALGRAPRRPWEQRVVRAARPTRTPARPTPGQVVPGAAAGPEFCYPDTRTNSLVVLATPLHQKQIEELISQLDRPVSLRDSYFVYPVQNLMASELANLVAPLVGADVKAQTLESAAGAAEAAGRAGGRLPTPFTPTRSRGVSGRGGTQARGAQMSPGDATGSPRRAALEIEPLAGPGEGRSPSDQLMIAQAPEAQGGVMVSPPEPGMVVVPQPVLPTGEPVSIILEEPAPVTPGTTALIVADDNSNVLLVSAPAEQLDLIQQMLEKMDVLPPQVYIRAIIAEVLLTRDTSLGFQWESFGRTLATYYDGDRANIFTGDTGTEFGLGLDPEEARKLGFFAAISGPEFQAVLSALTTDSHVRILATPSIFTSNNVKAQINVSKSIPFPRSTVEYQTGLGATSTFVDYKSVGIVVDVTPRVTQGDMVRMEVSVSSDELGESITVGGETYPTTNQRSANATINVKDGYTVVLGGLMRDTIHRSASRVPLLGDIPIVGSLFRSTNSKREKSELLVFLTPQVVRTATEAAQMTDREKSTLPEVPRSLQPPAAGTDAQ